MPLEIHSVDGVNSNVNNLIQESVGASPGRMSAILVELAALNSYLSENLDQILISKTDVWMHMRQGGDVKSDKMADRLWDQSPDGKMEILLRGSVKRIEKVMSALKLRLRIKESEARGIM